MRAKWQGLQPAGQVRSGVAADTNANQRPAVYLSADLAL
jgi:hypothetical protein